MKTTNCFIVFMLLLATACNTYQGDQVLRGGKTQSAIQTSLAVENDFPESCIPPIDDFVYSNSPDPTKPVPGETLIIAPPSPWEVVAPLPEPTGDYYLFSRTVNGQVEVWIERPATDDLIFEFLVYQTGAKQWKTVPAEIEGSKISVGKLFVAKDGSLWGQVGGPFILSNLNWKSALAKYDEKTKRFHFFDGAREIAAGRKDESEKTQLPYWSIVLQDAKGVLWVLVHKDGIYSFDPESQQVKKYIDLPDTVFSTAAISPDADIYYLKDLNYFDIPGIRSVRDMQIYQFRPETGGNGRISINLEPWPFFYDMLFDHKGRLWLDGIGFRDSDGTWFELARSSVFVTNRIEDSIDDRWKQPSIMMESSDHRIWFRSSNGTVWLDLEKRQWCWFTTYQSNVVEDVQHNLWMIADGKLYKYPLKP
jgi:hypothetical protein